MAKVDQRREIVNQQQSMTELLRRGRMDWQPIETAPRDGSAILLLSIPYESDFGEANGGIHHFPAKVAIGHWWAEGTSWVPEGPHKDAEIYLAKTGTWLSGGGWFQPDEVSHWMPLPAPPDTLEVKNNGDSNRDR